MNIVEVLNWVIFVYAVSIMTSYFILSIYSAWAIGEHFNHNNTANFENILRSPLAPKIAVIAPAYNESISIVDNIRSLLSLHYNNYEIGDNIQGAVLIKIPHPSVTDTEISYYQDIIMYYEDFLNWWSDQNWTP